MPPRQSHRTSRAFTLVELLAVVAILVTLASLSAVSMSSVTSRKLDQGGSLLVGLASQARQNSISRNVMTALVMVKDFPDSEYTRRSFILMEKGVNQTEWSPVTKWNFLPTGIVAAEGASFISQTPDILVSSLPKIAGHNVDPSSCASQIFLPNGGLSVKGVTIPKVPVLRLLSTNAASANYYDIRLNLLTGLPRVERP